MRSRPATSRGSSTRAAPSFYAVAFVPFLCLAVAVLAQDLLRTPTRPRILVAGLALTAIATNFVWFLPLYTAHPIPTAAWQARI